MTPLLINDISWEEDIYILFKFLHIRIEIFLIFVQFQFLVWPLNEVLEDGGNIFDPLVKTPDVLNSPIKPSIVLE